MRRLGSGGFGVVFEAFDRERGSPVALKTLRRVEPEALYRFKQEFRALVDIAHPNLAALYELMSAEGQWFFTMELIRGVNFLDYVTDRFPSIDAESPDDGFPSPFPLAGAGAPSDADATTMNLEFDAEAMASLAAPPSLLGIRRPASQTDRLREGLRQVAEGLRALHDSGRLHRDIKPSNVLVTRDGRVKIVDFGLVADLGADGPESTVQIVGTPAYMAPEQAAMRPVSPASDWYSVGVLLFEALTGRLPFEGSSLEVLALKQVDKPPEPARFSPEAPEDLNALCRDLLRLDPSRRPSAMQVLSRLAGGPHPTVPPGAARRVLPLLGRREHLLRLQEALEESRRSHAVTILVHGRSGTGKSALLRHFFHEIPRREPSAVVLSGRCYQQESVPYKALDSLIDGLSQYLKSLPPRECEEFLPREGLALARVFPVLLQVPAVAAAKRQVPEIPDSRELRRRAIEALRDLLSRIASRNPLVLAIDDLQWGDLDSASLLAQLLAPPAAPKLLLIAAYRSEDLGSSAILKLLSSREPFPGSAADVREIAVGDLDFADARTLAAMLLGEIGRDTPETAAAIARESGGNPFFIQELARAVRADTAPRPRGESGGEPAATSLDALIRERVERLAPESRRLLEIVSVAGAPLPREVAKRAAALGEE
ncbi:MAG TPA: protein kinase, partial [Thermoanaerobaculia bacterium]|nr:protein kinase [Thermoanaerobaculia bacterium]